MTAYLVKHLRDEHVCEGYQCGSSGLMEEAADRIEQLEVRTLALVERLADDDARIEELETALRKIVEYETADRPLPRTVEVARRALEGTKDT